MSISFSGLGSGIDTSSWVSSLVALRQAKVTSLETEKSSVVLSQETLSNIKSFFSSFRSLIEKVTDTKFNVSSMDLFAQNLANSSNTNVVSASVTSAAEESTYNVSVEKLASSTQATSGYTTKTTIVTTTTATGNSKLTDIGVQFTSSNATLGINVGGEVKTISLNDKDTISSFALKLNSVGVDAEYNEKSGVFSMDISSDSIVNASGVSRNSIINAFNLTDEVTGYTSNKLQISNTDTEETIADRSTKLSDLGVNNGTITVKTESSQFDIKIETGDTLGDLIDVLQDNGADVNFTDDGYFSLNNASIVTDGLTGIIDALGLRSETAETVINGVNLEDKLHQTVQVAATGDTMMSDIITANKCEIYDSNGELLGEVRLTKSSTVDSFFNAISSYGVSGEINDGVITLTSEEGNYIAGDVADALGIGSGVSSVLSQTVGKTCTSSCKVTYTEYTPATLNTKLVDLGYSVGDCIRFNGATTGIKSTSITISSTMTIDDVNAYLIDSYGISLNIDNEGLISIDGYDETKPLNAYVKLKAGGTTKFLGITFETTTVTVGTTATSTTAIQYTKTSTVTSTTTLGSIYSKTIDGTITSSGVTGSVIAISTVTDLKNLSKLVSAGNTMEGKTFVLTNDIDFNNATFNQIGGNSSGTNIYFSGTFDGQGYTIKNIKYADCGNHSMSLFYGLDNAEVKNLNLDNVQGYINSNGCINGLAEKINSSTVSNVNFTNINFTIAANSTSTTTVRSATLSQTVNNSTIYGVSASGTIVDESSDGVGKWGGSFIHSAYGNVTIEACSTDVDFYEKSGAIGSFSFLRNVQSTAENVTISNCRIGGNANAFVHFLEDGYAGTLTITNTYGLADVEGRISSKIGVLEFNESEGKPSGAKYVNNNSFWLVNEDTEVPDPEELYYVNANEEFCVYQIGYDVENIAELFSSYSSSLWTATKQKSPTEYTLPTLCPDSDYSMKVYNSKHEIISYVTTNASTTLADIQSSLSSAGLSSSLINGIFSIGNSSTYKYVSGKLATNLGIGLSSVVHAQNVTSTAVVIDTSTQEAITEDTSLGDLELYDSQLIPITNNTLGATTTFASSTTSTTFKLPSIKKIHYECNIYTEDYGYTTVSLLSTSTIGDMIDCLAEYGINSYVNNGRLTICNSDSAYVSGIGQVTTTGATSYYIYAPVDFCIDENLGVNTYGVNTTSDTPLNIETIETLDSVSKGSVKLSDIGTFTSSNQYITINQNGTNYTLTITTDSTVDDVLRRISAYGIDTSLNSSGKVVLKGNDNSYIVGMSDNLSSALKLSTYGLNTTKITGTYSTDGTQYKTANSNTPIAMDTNLTDLGLSGVYNIAVKNGESTYNIRINLDNNSSNSIKTIEDLADSLAVYGVNMSLNNGVVTIQGNENSYILECDSALSSALKLGGNFYKVNYNTIMGNTTSSTLLTNSITPSLSRATLLSDLGVAEGVFKVVKDGVAYKSSIYEGETVGDLINNLASFGVITNIVDDENGTYLQLDTTGNLSIQGLETLFSDNTEHTYNYAGSVIQTTTNTDVQTATLATLLSDYDEGLLKAAGSLCIVQGDNISKIQISDDETFASFMDKLKEVGIESCLTDGKLDLYSNSEFKLQGITSNVCATLGLLKNTSINGYSMSADAVMETTSSVQELNNSVSAFANYNTKLSDLGISDGTLSIYNDGKKSIVQIDSSQTFADLRSKIATLSPDTDLSFDDGHLTFTSKSGATINIGTGNDTSNFAAVVGISGESGSVVKSSRELYKVNTSSLLTESGLFKAGDVTTGTFTIGNAEFTIDNKTTLGDLISQINSKEDAQTSAYWDSINGKLVLKSNTTGGAYINIEAGTSNFTDIMGYTYQENSVNHLNTSTQNLGSNAKFTINDTKYSSTSNTVTSDITRIKGLTLNLKGISDSGETATITVEKDKNSVADALSDIVDSYNELIDKIDTEVATGANLSDQSTLRLIRNQIRSIMTSSVSYNSVFKNLDSIGISLVSASNGNIDTSNVNTLVFDKDKFIDAYSLDSSSLKSLLVGDGTSKGILTQVEDIVESALQSVTGYFALAEKSYTTKISSLDSKITKAQQSVSTYQSRLEAKFSTMDMLIANMQNQYSSFLTS